MIVGVFQVQQILQSQHKKKLTGRSVKNKINNITIFINNDELMVILFLQIIRNASIQQENWAPC